MICYEPETDATEGLSMQ